MKFSVCVTFQLFPQHGLAFLDAAIRNAAKSLSLEPGCHQFDVCTDDDYLNEVFLYEVYSSPEAFDIHLNSEHFKEFEVEVAGMIEEKRVKTYGVVSW